MPNGHINDTVAQLQADLIREREARRIVDKALLEMTERAEHWENEARTVGQVEELRRQQITYLCQVIAASRDGLLAVVKNLEQLAE